MRPDQLGNPLDLNNLPEEYGKQVLEESSTTTAASTDNSRFKKKKKEAKDESGKIYECRFCSLKFCKSQALGGHMNRHRQERETETLNRARQLVFSNDSITGGGAHMGLRDLNFGSSMQTMAPPSSCFQQQMGHVGDPRFQFRPAVYPRISAPATSYMSYAPSSYPPSHAPPPPPPPPPPPLPTNDNHFIGRVLGSSPSPAAAQNNPNYPFFGTSPTAAGATRAAATQEGSWNCGHRFSTSTSADHHPHPSNYQRLDRFRDDI